MRSRITLPRAFTFGQKLFVSYLALLVASVLVLGYFAYSSSLQSFQEKTSTTFQATLSQIRDNIAYKMNEMERISDDLFFDQMLQDSFHAYRADYYSYERLKDYVYPKLNHLVQSAASRMWISLYAANPDMPEIQFHRSKSIDPLAAGNNFEIRKMEQLAGEQWYKQRKHPDDVYDYSRIWERVDTDPQFDNVSLLRRLVHFNNGSAEIGFIRMIVKLDDLFQAASFGKITDKSALVITDGEGNTLYSSHPETGSEDEPNWTSGSYYRIGQTLDGLDWRITAYIPNRFFAENAAKVRDFIVAVCLLNLTILILAGALFSRYFTRRVGKVIATIESFREGDFHKRIRFKGRDEFAQIAHAFNAMGQNIEDLIQNLYVANLQKKEAELESLQAQISPHFLYNTLSSISQLAKLGETQKLQKTVLGLARFYRLSLNEGQIFTSVEQELLHVKTYVELQQVKYEDRLIVYYDIEPAILPLRTIKLVLQPFVENALKHAWFGDRIHIRITARPVGETVEFRVIDDGVGISREILMQIRDHNCVQVGYGIRNVDMRVKLQFGESYGVSIYSRLGIGTTGVIVIPANSELTEADKAVGPR